MMMMTAPVTKLFVDSEHTIISACKNIQFLHSGFYEDDGRDVLITDIGEGIESDIESKIQAMGDKALYSK